MVKRLQSVCVSTSSCNNFLSIILVIEGALINA